MNCDEQQQVLVIPCFATNLFVMSTVECLMLCCRISCFTAFAASFCRCLFIRRFSNLRCFPGIWASLSAQRRQFTHTSSDKQLNWDDFASSLSSSQLWSDMDWLSSTLSSTWSLRSASLWSSSICSIKHQVFDLGGLMIRSYSWWLAYRCRTVFSLADWCNSKHVNPIINTNWFISIVQQHHFVCQS